MALLLSRIRPKLLIRNNSISSSILNCNFCGSILLRNDNKFNEINSEIVKESKSRREPIASTSSIPYNNSIPSTTLDPPPHEKTTISIPKETTPTSLSDVRESIKSNGKYHTLTVVRSLPIEQLSLMERNLFDQIFSHSTFEKGVPHGNARGRWKALEILYGLAKDKGWELSDAQLREVFEAGVKWEQIRFDNSKLNPEEKEVGKTVTNVFKRSSDIEPIRVELLAREGKTWDEVRRDEETMEKYALLMFRKELQDQLPPSTTSTSKLKRHHKQPPIIPITEYSPPDSILLLKHLRKNEYGIALLLMNTMIKNRQIPSLAVMLEIISLGQEVEVNTYDQARNILDNNSTSSKWNAREEELDTLLQQRLDKLDRDEWIKKYPTLAFIKYLSLEQKNLPPMKELNWLQVGLKLWELIYSPEELSLSEEDSQDSLPYASVKLLAELITTSSQLEAERLTSTKQASAAIITSVQLSTKYLPPYLLSTIADQLLLAITVSSPSPIHSRNLYHHLRTTLPLGDKYAFNWKAVLLPSYSYLCRMAVVGPKGINDPQFVVQLYLDFTASGLILPQPYWGFLWRGLGARGSLEEVNRLLGDYHKIAKIDAGIYGIILRSSIRTGKIVPTLRLFELLQKRSGGSEIDIEVINQVLELLATSNQDRRSDSLDIFQSIISARIRPTIETWNALLAGHVFRSRLTMEDLDGAGKIYNSLVLAGFIPDRFTHSLLIHGFTRISIEGQNVTLVRNFGLDAALNTFNKAFEEGILIRGDQTGKLMQGLGKIGRWEEAKGVGEKWWRLNLMEGNGIERDEGEERIVLKATEMIISRESKILGEPSVVTVPEESFEKRFKKKVIIEPEDEVSIASFSLTLSNPEPNSIEIFTPNPHYSS